MVLALVFAVSSMVCACSDKPSNQDCEALLEKIVDLEIASGGTASLPAAMKTDLEKSRKEVKDYLREQFMKQCLDSTPVAVVKCGLQAKSKADYAACDTK